MGRGGDRRIGGHCIGEVGGAGLAARARKCTVSLAKLRSSSRRVSTSKSAAPRTHARARPRRTRTRPEDMLVDEQRSVAAGSPAQPVQGVPVMQGVPIAVPVIGANAAGAPPVMVAGPVPLSMSRAADATHAAGSSGSGVSTSELEGCWCVPALGGLYCYGLQAFGEDAMLGNPVPCILGLPYCSAWGLGTCGVPVFTRDGLNDGTTFQNRSEGLQIRVISRGRISSNLFGQVGSRAAAARRPRPRRLAVLTRARPPRHRASGPSRSSSPRCRSAASRGALAAARVICTRDAAARAADRRPCEARFFVVCGG